MDNPRIVTKSQVSDFHAYSSGDQWTSGSARQGQQGSKRYEGIIGFYYISQIKNPLQGLEVAQMRQQWKFGKTGATTGTKILNLYEASEDNYNQSMSTTWIRGPLMGTISVSGAYDNYIDVDFDKNTNSEMFKKLVDYFITRQRKYLVLYVPTTRGMSGKNDFCLDYLSVTGLVLSVTFGCPPTECTFTPQPAEIGKLATMTLSPANNGFTHTIKWTFGNQTKSWSMPAGTRTVSWTIPQDWAKEIPNTTNGIVDVNVQTNIPENQAQGLKIITTSERTYQLPINVPSSMVPTIGSLTVSPENTNSKLKEWGIFVQGKTKAKITMYNYAGSYGSTIKSYSILTTPNIGNATTSTLQTDIINIQGTFTVNATVMDSRGRTATKSMGVQVYQYVNPSLSSIEIYRCNSAGTRNEVSGTYVHIVATAMISPLYNNRNSSTIVVQITKVGGSSVVNQTVLSGKGYTLGNGNIATDSEYNVTITVRDTIGSVSTYTYTILSAAYLLHFKKGGKAIGVGMAAGADNTISMGWPLKLKTPLELSQGGTGATTATQACTNIGALPRTGKAVSATQADSVKASLTAGTKHYNGSTTVTLTAADVGAAQASHEHKGVPMLLGIIHIKPESQPMGAQFSDFTYTTKIKPPTGANFFVCRADPVYNTILRGCTVYALESDGSRTVVFEGVKYVSGSHTSSLRCDIFCYKLVGQEEIAKSSKVTLSEFTTYTASDPALPQPEMDEVYVDEGIARADYIGMMAGIEIPADEVEVDGVQADAGAVEAPSAGESLHFEAVKLYHDAKAWNAQMVKNAVGKWITADEANTILSEERN